MERRGGEGGDDSRFYLPFGQSFISMDSFGWKDIPGFTIGPPCFYQSKKDSKYNLVFMGISSLDLTYYYYYYYYYYYVFSFIYSYSSGFIHYLNGSFTHSLISLLSIVLFYCIFIIFITHSSCTSM